ncbi:ABC-type sugar transport system, substrate-binding protein, contains N-terminal xre family HTH domain [Desulfopila aestuarii DSM 18488]|uniref:ABC-type sugar transport system, substrate-binding protein, contains N-terminal xre family HTH domain n=2 Tax=Desulfopila aestuarii TaxID=231440 RepID=A0A1M7YLG2_9BACT|nr:ABC-type sugar transport system, substrate-binding protein, contains N-terminal xre family HTH domain [Desulfopila aestuarii DSM 18488]
MVLFQKISVILMMLVIFVFPDQVQADKRDSVALVMKSLASPFFSTMAEGAQNYAKEHGIALDMFGVEQETDVDHQINIIANLISLRYGAIILAPTHSEKLIPICKKALDAGIAVITLDTHLDSATMAKAGISIPFIGTDNRIGGQMVGNYLKNRLNGKGRILAIGGYPGVENGIARIEGFIDAITQNSEIEIVASENANWRTDEALAVVSRLITKHGKIDAIFCANDFMALGALQAVDLLGLSSEIFITGYDNLESVRTEMRNGRIVATIEQHPELMGQYGVEAALNSMHGEPVALERSTPVDLITYESFGKKVTLSVSNLSNAFFATLSQHASKTATLFGIELAIKDAQDQDSRQLLDITSSSDESSNLLIINPTNAETIGPGIAYAVSLGIPVITVDRKVAVATVLSHIASDNTEGGKIAARYMAELLIGEGNVFEIEGIPGTSAAHERGAGFNSELGKYSTIEVVHRESADFNRETAKAVMLRSLPKYPNLNGIFAHNDAMLLGAVDAYQEAGKRPPRVLIGFDASSEAREAVKKGIISGTIAQQPDTMGKLAIETAVKFFRGEDIPREITVDLTLITH